jgi:hypothetical protein
MNQKAALCKALLEGKVVNIKNGFTWFGITNIPREIGRSIERSFDVKVSRTNMEGKSRYGQTCIWIDYRLNKTDYNAEGMKKMADYVKKHLSQNIKTDNQKQQLREAEELQKWFSEYQNEKPPLTTSNPNPMNLFTQLEMFK